MTCHSSENPGRRALNGVLVAALTIHVAGCANLISTNGPHGPMQGWDAANAASRPSRGDIRDLFEGEPWLIGAAPDKIAAHDHNAAHAACERSARTPAEIEDVRRSDAADLNSDGFISVDEVVALRKAGLGSEEIIDRLHRSGQVFYLPERQEYYLVDRGVSPAVISFIRSMQPPEIQAAPATAPSQPREPATRPSTSSNSPTL